MKYIYYHNQIMDIKSGSWSIPCYSWTIDEIDHQQILTLSKLHHACISLEIFAISQNNSA